ncbi:hypothetical protein D9613_010154 [Agrocybe pediades]|uniref:Uncharacterized protein n=1 Tax=Agrocybe pediades TaxID=84607 RepID=A0A8H4VQK1_9AGAR|nr:hypothetical protein D9613_010154 [Agrocybe pediades]
MAPKFSSPLTLTNGLIQKGYRLPERYNPDWIPSWFGKKYTDKNLHDTEPDGVFLRLPKLLNAVRVSDGKKVVLKKVSPKVDVPNLEFLNSPKLVADSRNNTVPLLHVIYLPDHESTALIAMPLLLHFNDFAAPFRFGLSSSHQNYIAHRDACYYNLMMDPSKIVPGGFNYQYPLWQEDLQRKAKYLDRKSASPVEYYFIDFETARILPPETYGHDPQLLRIIGQDKTVPEWSKSVQAYNPFRLDIYQLGSVMRRVVEEYDGLDLFLPFCTSMMKENQYERLTAAEGCSKFHSMVSAMTAQDMDSRVWPKTLSAKRWHLIASKSKGLLKCLWVPVYEFFQDDDDWP